MVIWDDGHNYEPSPRSRTSGCSLPAKSPPGVGATQGGQQRLSELVAVTTNHRYALRLPYEPHPQRAHLALGLHSWSELARSEDTVDLREMAAQEPAADKARVTTIEYKEICIGDWSQGSMRGSQLLEDCPHIPVYIQYVRASPSCLCLDISEAVTSIEVFYSLSGLMGYVRMRLRLTWWPAKSYFIWNTKLRVPGSGVGMSVAHVLKAEIWDETPRRISRDARHDDHALSGLRIRSSTWV